MPVSALADVNIRVNGRNLPKEAQLDLKRVVVDEALDVASFFTLEFYNWDDTTLRHTWSDSKLFAPGSEVEIWLGYVGRLERVMVAEITGIEANFVTQETPTLIVQGYDHRHRLFRGRYTRSFTKMKDSAIASQLAHAAGLRAQVTDTGVTLAYVLQHNQTDDEFLQERAQRIGYEFFVRDRTLYFQPHQNSKPAAMTLSLMDDVLAFHPRLTTLGQIGEVAVRGWDVQQKQVVSSKASAGQETPMMGGRMSGPRAAKKAFGQASTAHVTAAMLDSAGARAIAQGQFNQMALHYIEGDGECRGRADLHAGSVIKIEGAGQTFSGLYYVTGVTHTVTQDDGYRAQFRVQRSAT